MVGRMEEWKAGRIPKIENQLSNYQLSNQPINQLSNFQLTNN